MRHPLPSGCTQKPHPEINPTLQTSPWGQFCRAGRNSTAARDCKRTAGGQKMSKLSGHSALQPMEVNTSPRDPIPAQRAPSWESTAPTSPWAFCRANTLWWLCAWEAAPLSAQSSQIYLYTDTVHSHVCCIQIRCVHGERGHGLVPHSSPKSSSPTGYPQRLSKETLGSIQTSIINTALQKTNVKMLLT